MHIPVFTRMQENGCTHKLSTCFARISKFKRKNENDNNGHCIRTLIVRVESLLTVIRVSLACFRDRKMDCKITTTDRLPGYIGN